MLHLLVLLECSFSNINRKFTMQEMEIISFVVKIAVCVV